MQMATLLTSASLDDVLTLTHGASCFALFGVIWIVQLVHYPAFSWVRQREFAAFARFHADGITPVVLPLMLAEAATAAALYWRARQTADSPTAWHVWNVASIALVWGATFALSVPCHERLSARGWHAATHARLVRTNWLRTAVWTARAGGVFVAALTVLGARGARDR